MSMQIRNKQRSGGSALLGPTRRRIERRFGALLLAASALIVGCDEKSQSVERFESETHFLKSCVESSSCGDGLECLCGVCTQACDGAAACDGLAAGASCVATSGACTAAELVCDVECDSDAECAGVSGTCQRGRCRDEQANSVSSDDEIVAPSDASTDETDSTATDTSQGTGTDDSSSSDVADDTSADTLDEPDAMADGSSASDPDDATGEEDLSDAASTGAGDDTGSEAGGVEPLTDDAPSIDDTPSADDTTGASSDAGDSAGDQDAGSCDASTCAPAEQLDIACGDRGFDMCEQDDRCILDSAYAYWQSDACYTRSLTPVRCVDASLDGCGDDTMEGVDPSGMCWLFPTACIPPDFRAPEAAECDATRTRCPEDLCWGKTLTECQNDPSCREISGVGVDPLNQCYSGENQPIGCAPASVGCLAVITTAVDPEGNCYLLSDSCAPAGFRGAQPGECPDENTPCE
jgi:hypothetical protein